ncbi:hypothetical protein [Streptomyces sp. NPDC059460]|uniref:hypothetical protein n=1 Tax=Streptomyces sp. NPDC059460 TaxID=3346840 RepID=UPI0036901038
MREQPELMPGAVEEFLHSETSAVARATSSYAAEDLEPDGVRIPCKGIVVALGSAGRDAPQAEDTDTGVLDVTLHPPLSGRPARRLETAIALRTLLTRLPEA